MWHNIEVSRLQEKVADIEGYIMLSWNVLYSQNVISVSTITIDTQMQKRYSVSIHKAEGIRGHGVTCVSDELPQMCGTLNFLYVDQCLQVTPEK